MSDLKQIDFIDHKAANDSFICVELNIAHVIKSWRKSIFSFQWLTSEGKLKDISALDQKDREKREAVEAAIAKGDKLEKAILGLGLQEHIEIGSGRAALLTMYAMGYETAPVHIPKSNEDEFKKFLS